MTVIPLPRRRHTRATAHGRRWQFTWTRCVFLCSTGTVSLQIPMVTLWLCKSFRLHHLPLAAKSVTPASRSFHSPHTHSLLSTSARTVIYRNKPQSFRTFSTYRFVFPHELECRCCNVIFRMWSLPLCHVYAANSFAIIRHCLIDRCPQTIFFLLPFNKKNG